MVNDMKNSALHKESADTQVYTPPVCQVILVGTQRVICGSETESVGETDGEW